MRGALPPNLLGLLNGVNWNGAYLEEVDERYGHGLDSALIPLLQATLTLVNQPPVLCYVRHYDSVRCVVVAQAPGYPTLAEAASMNVEERWCLLAKAAGFLQSDLCTPFLADKGSARFVSFFAIVQSLIAISRSNPSDPMNLSTPELLALLAAFLDTSSEYSFPTVTPCLFFSLLSSSPF